MRIAAVDIGTNTALLLIADVGHDGRIVPVGQEQRFPRIGANLYESGEISRDKFDETVSILREFKRISEKAGAGSFIVCGTSALRDASNGPAFRDYVSSRCDCDLEVISGRKEAELSFLGAMSGFRFEVGETTVIDIGGGSSEITQYSGTELTSHSYQIGAVRLSGRYFLNDPPTEDEINSAREAVSSLILRGRTIDKLHRYVIGVAGTLTALACLDKGLKYFSADEISGHLLFASAVARLSRMLLSMKSSDILNLSGVMSGRADIISAGSLILEEIMKIYSIERITVSDRGLRHGMVLKEWEKMSNRR